LELLIPLTARHHRFCRSTWIAAALLLAQAAVLVPAGAAQATTPAVPVTVVATNAFTDSGLDVQAGTTVTIAASGKVQYQRDVGSTVTPAGIPWGPHCRAGVGLAHNAPFPVPGVACWSLIGKIGAGRPFAIGTSQTFSADSTGKLLLGINDNYLPDNSGFWTATVSVAGAAPATSSGPSVFVPVLALAAIAALVACLIGWLLVRRRNTADKETAPAASTRDPLTELNKAPQPEPVLATATRMSPERRAAMAPYDPESADVNIFRVEIEQRSSLVVGYNFFPEGTVVEWRVARNDGVTLVSGEFVAQGGGSVQHVESMPLDGGVLAELNAVDVAFAWTIRDVPFGYDVSRDL
jgi:hypothetical protein